MSVAVIFLSSYAISVVYIRLNLTATLLCLFTPDSSSNQLSFPRTRRLGVRSLRYSIRTHDEDPDPALCLCEMRRAPDENKEADSVVVQSHRSQKASQTTPTAAGKAAEATKEKGNHRLFNTVVRSRLEGFISQLHS